jgi:UDP-N-acetylmuramoyl-tripeptide--D-alanyl-D-alanine ligase
VIRMSLSDVASAIGATGDATGEVSGEVRIDSRAVQAGDLFVALRGEHADGHDFAQTAVDAGAVAVVVERPSTDRDLVVADALVALQSLARQVFSVDQPLTFGITGSSGKTSTKDLLAQVLAGFGPTLAPVGSFNNEIGLPLTATQRTSDTAYAALEYSARGIGHIAFLCGIVPPHVAIVLNVGSAHLGEFGSAENIAVAKGELVEAATSLAVLNADDPLVAGMADRTQHRVVTYGTGTADYRATDIELDDEGRPSYALATPHGTAPVRLQLRGEHQVANSLAVAAAVLGSGVTDDVARVAELLAAAQPVSRWRMEVTERADGVTVVNDAYNANPESMRAALRTLAVMSRGGTRRTWAVLGQMAELGPDAAQAHRDLGRFAVGLDVSRLLVIGSEAAGIHAGAVQEGSSGEKSVHVDDVDVAIARLREELRPGDVVLVKASRAARLERVAEAVLADTG